LTQETQIKETKDLTKSKHSNAHYLSKDLDTSDDEGNAIYASEFTWSSKDKSHLCFFQAGP
jgi:hypothetical protein